MKALIAKITFKIGGREIELTAEEARKIYKELDKMFGPQIDPAPITQPSPIIIERDRWPQPWTTKPDITCEFETKHAVSTC